MTLQRKALGEWQNVVAVLLCLLTALGCATTSQLNETNQRVGLFDVKMDQSLEKIRQDQAEIKADLIDIRTNTQSLTGELSTRQHEAAQKASLEGSMAMQLQHLEQQTQHLEKRLQLMEELLGISPPVSTAPAGVQNVPGPAGTPGAPTSEPLTGEGGTTPPSNMKQAYEAAFTLYREGNIEAARAAFIRFMDNFPKSELADNALFWIGETYYRTGNFKEAIVQYHELIEKYPKGSKVPDALLKQGLAFSMIGEKEAAISSLKKLIQRYPNAPHVIAAKKKLETWQVSEKPASTRKKSNSAAKDPLEKP